jgi:hypothetical protein
MAVATSGYFQYICIWFLTDANYVLMNCSLLAILLNLEEKTVQSLVCERVFFCEGQICTTFANNEE